MENINISFERTPTSELPKGLKTGVSLIVNGRTFAILEAKTKDPKIENKWNKFSTDFKNNFSRSENKKLKINKWVPLRLDNNEIVYIKPKELFLKTLLGDEKVMLKGFGQMLSLNEEDRIGLSGEAGKILEGKVQLLEKENQPLDQQADIITYFFQTTLEKQKTLIDTRPNLHGFFDRTLPNDIQETIKLKQELPPINLDKIGLNEELISMRTGISSTMRKMKVENKQALENWKKADKFVTNMVMQNKPIELSDIQQINKILTAGLTNNEGKPGVFRRMGENILGAQNTYVIGAHVHEEMKNFNAWLHTQLKLCDNGLANPVVIATSAAQRLISIHPFHDANGRTGLLVLNYVLEKYGIPPSSPQDSNFAVFGGLPEHHDRNVQLEKAVLKVRDGILRTCEILRLDSPFLEDEPKMTYL